MQHRTKTYTTAAGVALGLTCLIGSNPAFSQGVPADGPVPAATGKPSAGVGQDFR